MQESRIRRPDTHTHIHRHIMRMIYTDAPAIRWRLPKWLCCGHLKESAMSLWRSRRITISFIEFALCWPIEFNRIKQVTSISTLETKSERRMCGKKKSVSLGWFYVVIIKIITIEANPKLLVDLELLSTADRMRTQKSRWRVSQFVFMDSAPPLHNGWIDERNRTASPEICYHDARFIAFGRVGHDAATT